MAKPYLSVIIPVYNEAKRLPLTLIDIDRHLSEQEYSYEILVVNDGSKDATAEIVERFKPLIENLKLVDFKENRGKGAVVRDGMQAAKGNWRLFMDADNSTSIIEFNKMIPYLDEGYEVVIGSRAVKGSKLNPASSLLRSLAGKFGNVIVQLTLLHGIWDTQCGFKCFSEEAARRIFSIARLNGWGFDAEALALAKKLGYQIKEMPVHWVSDSYSHVRLSSYFLVLWDTLRIRWWLWRKSYNLNG
ncbi:MAG: dolichyl-phosphate beta-glucosyltransferase [Patescibacteria group bacterium]